MNHQYRLASVAVLAALLGCQRLPDLAAYKEKHAAAAAAAWAERVRTSECCFGIPNDFSGSLNAEQERMVPQPLRQAYYVESVQKVNAAELGEKLKLKTKLLEETSHGNRYVAVQDYRCVESGNGTGGMLIVVERYRVADK